LCSCPQVGAHSFLLSGRFKKYRSHVNLIPTILQGKGLSCPKYITAITTEIIKILLGTRLQCYLKLEHQILILNVLLTVVAGNLPKP
jgi:hypothetical protein